ncbi:MAG: urea ABC transporter permease subunit UrtC [Candidatus Accumulibacter sp.]|jgi:urea transport system permease protein|nr:urea ABC transporter permease subunit UrtC [Accumulibacter sp.]
MKTSALNTGSRKPSLARRLFGRQGGWAILSFAAFTLVVIPALNLLVPAESAFHLQIHWVSLSGKIMCYAIAALALDLVWGYTGILSLGHGFFFALGGYAIGMYLMRVIDPAGLPPFMVFLDWKDVPWFWRGTGNFLYVFLLVPLVSGFLAFAFGFFAFRSRIKGVYFSIITQAMTLASMLLFFRNETGFGGNNGFTGFTRILGRDITAPGTRVSLFMLTALTLIAAFCVSRYIVTSKLGRVLTAIRDAESRVMFSGYDPLPYKLFIWTFSAILSAVAGALFVPQVGIINPSEMSPAHSVEIAIWVAVGGRGTLVGPIVGAGLVNGVKSWFTVSFPEVWLYALGGIFVLVTLFLPRGILGLFDGVEKT